MTTEWWLALAVFIAWFLAGVGIGVVAGIATGVTLALAEPVTAFALAVLVLREQPTTTAFVGLAFVPDAIRDLAHALLDRPRVRVQRVTR